MFESAIWHKLPLFIFKMFLIFFSKIMRVIYPKLPKVNMWSLINHNKHFVLKLIYILTEENYKSARGQLQNCGQSENNTVNGGMLITFNRVVKLQMQQINLRKKISAKGAVRAEKRFTLFILNEDLK